MTVESVIKEKLTDGFNSCFEIDLNSSELKLEYTNKEFDGDYTFVVFPYLRQTRKNPVETATVLGQWMQDNWEGIESFNVVNGFLNITLTSAFWTTYFSNNEVFQIERPVEDLEKVMVEYSSPNTNKPLHLGHVRNNVLGYSICRILEAYGHEVVKVNLINDRGIHICKSMLAYQKFGNGETPESSQIKGDHLVGKYYVLFDIENKKQAKELIDNGADPENADRATPLMDEARVWLVRWEKKDPEIMDLWNTMNGWVYAGFDQTYKRMGVSFDHIYKESETYLLGKDIVEEGLQKGVFYGKEDNSVWVDLTDVGLDHKLLLRGDGTSVYMTQDIGTAELKYRDYKMGTSVYVVGNEQDYHFKVLQAIMQKLQKPYADGIQHMSYGMVELPEGKLKTREGKVVDADNLMDEMYETAKERTIEQGKTEGVSEEDLQRLYETLGLGALKYFLLKVDPTKRILFNPSESIDFQGNTATFIQYTHARCCSILRSKSAPNKIPQIENMDPTERALLIGFYQFSEKVAEAARNYSPSIIAQYMYDLAKLFNSFYNQCSILHVEDKNTMKFRLFLTDQTSKGLRSCGEMLGIEMPLKM